MFWQTLNDIISNVTCRLLHWTICMSINRLMTILPFTDLFYTVPSGCGDPSGIGPVGARIRAYIQVPTSLFHVGHHTGVCGKRVWRHCVLLMLMLLLMLRCDFVYVYWMYPECLICPDLPSVYVTRGSTFNMSPTTRLVAFLHSRLLSHIARSFELEFTVWWRRFFNDVH